MSAAILAERTLLVLSKSAQPISKLGFALAAIAGRNRDVKSGAVADEKVR